ncbi:hypothetical protein M9434_006378 [Picochlorum sp. BPE23]|nr:hypothetical protein M9434_006378 [Picochlorum sp. BPE23]KAI8109025.1 hypothetical protein M9435_005442 [Picochlorum sp. BPE23]
MEGSMHVERMPEDDSPRALRRHIQGLEKKLAMVSLERDDLARDVEAMCLDSASNTTFNMSSVLNERIFVAEKQLSKVKKELVECDSERKSLVEDMYALKEAKRRGDDASRQQKERLDVLGREVVFYREQATQAISERDEMTWELEHVRRELEGVKDALAEKESKCSKVEVERDVLKQQLDEAEGRMSGLEKAAAVAEEVPRLKKTIEKLEKQTEALEKTVTDVTCERNVLKEALDRQRLDFDEEKTKLIDSYTHQIDSLKNDMAHLQEEVMETKEELSNVTEQKIESLMRLSDSESSTSQMQRELKRLTTKIGSLESLLEAATQEKVKALLEAAEAQAAVTRSPSNSQGSSIHASPFHSPVKKR